MLSTNCSDLVTSRIFFPSFGLVYDVIKQDLNFCTLTSYCTNDVDKARLGKLTCLTHSINLVGQLIEKLLL